MADGSLVLVVLRWLGYLAAKLAATFAVRRFPSVLFFEAYRRVILKFILMLRISHGWIVRTTRRWGLLILFAILRVYWSLARVYSGGPEMVPLVLAGLNNPENVIKVVIVILTMLARFSTALKAISLHLAIELLLNSDSNIHMHVFFVHHLL